MISCVEKGDILGWTPSFQGRGLRREFPLLLFLPPSFHHTEVYQMQWFVVGRGLLSHAIGIPLLSGSHCMSHLNSGCCGIWPGSRSCSCWHTLLCCTVASLPGIVIWWGVARIDLRSIASSVSLVTQWGIGLYWYPVRCNNMPPSCVVYRLSDLK